MISLKESLLQIIALCLISFASGNDDACPMNEHKVNVSDIPYAQVGIHEC